MFEYIGTARRCIAIKTASRRVGRWNGQLIEVQVRELRSDQVWSYSHVSETIASSDWEFQRIIQPRIIERALSMHFQIGNKRIPVSHAAPPSPRMEIHSSQAECRRNQCSS